MSETKENPEKGRGWFVYQTRPERGSDSVSRVDVAWPVSLTKTLSRTIFRQSRLVQSYKTFSMSFFVR